MKKSTKIIIALLIVIALIGGLIGYFVIRDLKQEKILDDEMDKIASLDITKDEIDMEIKTTGDYAKIEKILKTYLSDYGKKAKTILEQSDDKSFSEVLNVVNLKKDAPEFINSEKTILAMNAVVKEIDKLIEMTDEKYMMSLIEKEKLDDYYIDLFKKELFDESVIKDLEEAKSQLIVVKKKIENLANVYTEAIKLLKDSKGKWEVSNNQLYFYNNELADKYNKIIAKI